jgi:hypothetical protein
MINSACAEAHAANSAAAKAKDFILVVKFMSVSREPTAKMFNHLQPPRTIPILHVICEDVRDSALKNGEIAPGLRTRQHGGSARIFKQRNALATSERVKKRPKVSTNRGTQ